MPDHPSAISDAYLTIADLSDRYQIPAETVRRWRIRGTGPKGIKIGKFVRYRIEDVLAWERQLAERSAR